MRLIIDSVNKVDSMDEGETFDEVKALNKADTAGCLRRVLP